MTPYFVRFSLAMAAKQTALSGASGVFIYWTIQWTAFVLMGIAI